MSNFANLLLIASLAMVAVARICGAAGAPTPPTTRAVTYLQHVRDRCGSVLDALEEGGNARLTESLQRLQAIFDQAVLYATDDPPDVLREADFNLRLAEYVRDFISTDRSSLLKYLRAHEELAATIAFLVHSPAEGTGTYTLLDRLRQERPEQVEKFPSLAAAICAVHHRNLVRYINENRVTAVDPVAIFDFFVKNESKMRFNLRQTPPELLIHVVDTTCPIDQMQWALQKYAGEQDIGHHFFDVKYDYASYRYGTPKAVTGDGYTLQNILKDGGVCADQAYFAEQIGKSIGVPTATAEATAGMGGHAWVGFLQSNHGDLAWNFDSGRYEAYRGLRGSALDPQTHDYVSDSFLSLQAHLIGVGRTERHNAIALGDAATRLMEIEGLGPCITAARKHLMQVYRGSATAPFVPPPLAPTTLPVVNPPPDVSPALLRTAARRPDTNAELSLFQAALRQCMAYPVPWYGVRDLALAGKLPVSDRRRWADLLCETGGAKYPDFTFDVVAPMLITIEDAKEQDQAWTNLLRLFKTRFDLIAATRSYQAANWESHHETEKARQCYMDVIDHYANAGPFVIYALQGAEKLLREEHRDKEVADLYKSTWNKTAKPKDMATIFWSQCNWYRVGKLYAKKLEEAGDSAFAARINAQLDPDPPTPDTSRHPGKTKGS